MHNTARESSGISATWLAVLCEANIFPWNNWLEWTKFSSKKKSRYKVFMDTTCLLVVINKQMEKGIPCDDETWGNRIYIYNVISSHEKEAPQKLVLLVRPPS